MASLSFHFKIELDDGTTTEVDSIPFDIIRWERKAKKSFASDDPTIESLLWLAWCAARRSDKTDLRLFDEWAVKVVGFDTASGDGDEEQGTEDGEVDPTRTED